MNRRLQELETKLSNTNDELEKTKEALEVAKNTIEQCKEKNVSLENRLSNREHVFQADSTSFRQKDVMLITYSVNYISFFINSLILY